MPWEPVETVPHWTAHEDEGETRASTGFLSETGQAAWSTTPFGGLEEVRNPKRCVANANTCNGWKANGTEHCVGHLKSAATVEKAVDDGGQ